CNGQALGRPQFLAPLPKDAKSGDLFDTSPPTARVRAAPASAGMLRRDAISCVNQELCSRLVLRMSSCVLDRKHSIRTKASTAMAEGKSGTRSGCAIRQLGLRAP